MPRPGGGYHGRGPGMGPGPGRMPHGDPGMRGPGPMGRPPVPPRRGWGGGPYRRGGCLGCLFPFLMGIGAFAALAGLMISLIV